MSDNSKPLLATEPRKIRKLNCFECGKEVTVSDERPESSDWTVCMNCYSRGRRDDD